MLILILLFLKGTWGIDCQRKCECASRNCNSVTGVCQCPPGRYGRKCEKVGCPPGFWGSECENRCPKACSTGYCHSKKGTCTCAPGKYGGDCQFTCPEGTFGEMCSNACPAACSDPKSNFKGCDPEVRLLNKQSFVMVYVLLPSYRVLDW